MLGESRSSKRIDKFTMDLSNDITTLGVALLLSIALFGAFKAGQVFERSNTQRILELDLEKLKLKTQSRLEMLWKEYSNNNSNMQLEEGLCFKGVVENAFLIDESLQEQILGLNKVYLDLISNGTGSSYFVWILDTYGQWVCS